MKRFTLVGVCAALTLSFDTIASESQYSFVRVADRTQFDSVFWGPVVNNSGQCAFFAWFLGGSGSSRGFVMGNGQSLEILVSTSASQLLTQHCDMNAAGTVVFSTINPSTLKTVDASGIHVVAGGPGSVFPGVGQKPGINDAGEVAFRGALPGGPAGIFKFGPAGFTTIAMADEVLVGFGNGASINDSGQVAFTATRAAGETALIRSDGRTTQTLADTTGEFESISPWPMINDAGEMLFIAEFDNGGNGLFIATNRGDLQQVVRSNETFLGVSSASFNDRGQVVFRARLVDGREGIFSGPDPVRDTLIIQGDPFGRSTVQSLDLSTRGVTNSGRVAFRVSLFDGTEALYRADPIPLSCSGDLTPGNGDGLVDTNDLVLVLTEWNVLGGVADIAPHNGNGVVDIDDLVQVITNWGACP